MTENHHATPNAPVEMIASPPDKAVYAGSWRRFGAMWIDALVFVPLMGLTYYFGEQKGDI